MSWVLVLMACQRMCVPTYAAVYPNQAQCEAVVDKDKGTFHHPRSYCVPVIREIK